MIDSLSKTAPSAPKNVVPYRLSAFYHKWKLAGASLSIDELGWQLPDHFARPEDEVLNAKENVVVGDISNVGKFSLKGMGALELCKKEFEISELTTVNPGSILNEAKDPALRGNCVCCILARDEALILSSGSSSKNVHDYFLQSTEGDFQTPEECAHTTDLTSFFAGLYLIGPKSRSVISKLSELNVNPEAMPNLSVAQSALFHVQSIVLRSDIGGLEAFQLFFDRGYGEFLLDRIMDSGNEFGIRPSGLVALRSLGWKWV